MGMFDHNVEVTGKYAFSFTTFVWEHPWDNKDYAYFHDVNEKNGKKAYRLLSEELGADGKSMEELLKMKFGEDPDPEKVFDYCREHGIEFVFNATMI